MSEWYVYILRCADNTFYTGITVDIDRRLDEHNNSNKLGAAYTRGRRPVELVYQESSATRSAATKREYEIRKMSKKQKEAFVNKMQNEVSR